MLSTCAIGARAVPSARRGVCGRGVGAAVTGGVIHLRRSESVNTTMRRAVVASGRSEVALAPTSSMIAPRGVEADGVVVGAWKGAALGAAALGAALLAPEHAKAAVEAVADVDPDQTSGFIQGLLLILFSEIGDKTFFIAVLLATQQDKKSVFAGTYGALVAMTVISVLLGQVLHLADESLPFETDFPWDDFLAAALLLYFGVQTIKSAEESKAEEEEEDAKEAVAEMGSNFSDEMALIASVFALVFAAEWGDKSFFATIALSAAADPLQVVGGAAAGHFIATAGAVVLGDVVGEYISERVVAYAGGSLFILFAVGTLVEALSK